jgi:cellulose 1,4-beta-cellobiosidase
MQSLSIHRCIRQLATNTSDPITQGNPNYDKLLYIQTLGPLLEAQNNFIVDQGRSGVQDILNQWGDWCNINGAGIGLHTSPITPLPYIDSFVGLKPRGESDGNSNSSAPHYNFIWSLSDAMLPCPQAGTWFHVCILIKCSMPLSKVCRQAYFVNANNPPL